MKKLIEYLKKLIDNLTLLVLFILNPFLIGLYQTIEPTKTRFVEGRHISSMMMNF